MEKLHEYQGWSGRFSTMKDNVKERFSTYRTEHPESLKELTRNIILKQTQANVTSTADYSHLYRTKTRSELVRVSAAVMGIEFSYAAETAFVSPTLLKIGVEHQHMTLVWALSPLVGFFLTPILGSLSDRCKLNLGRRRPFIILLSFGVFIGLLLVPNGENLGYTFGDINPSLQIAKMNLTNETVNNIYISPHRSTASETEISNIKKTSHPWGIFFTILGTVLLDFDADACQSPARAYLLDVTVPEDHVRGLSTFTIMAGLGGFMGYSLGGINWDNTTIGRKLGGHVKAVFTLITFLFVACVTATITSFREMPLWLIESNTTSSAPCNDNKISQNDVNETDHLDQNESEMNYGSLKTEHSNEIKGQINKPINTDHKYTLVEGDTINETSFNENSKNEIGQRDEAIASLSHYLLSIVFMPHSLRMVCITNLFCWMAHVCYSLYFTDFVAEAVFQGDPRAIEGSQSQILYEEGVRFGCWGMAMYSLSCACYSFIIEKLIKKFKAKPVYVGGLLFYCAGMTLMALTRAKFSVIVFSWAAGVMYSTLFTMPYLLVAHYHSEGIFEISAEGEAMLGSEIRGIGTDVAIVSSMVFLAQFILSICMGTIVSWAGTTTAVVSVASFLSFCGAIAATQIMYLNL